MPYQKGHEYRPARHCLNQILGVVLHSVPPLIYTSAWVQIKSLTTQGSTWRGSKQNTVLSQTVSGDISIITDKCIHLNYKGPFRRVRCVCVTFRGINYSLKKRDYRRRTQGTQLV